MQIREEIKNSRKKQPNITQSEKQVITNLKHVETKLIICLKNKSTSENTPKIENWLHETQQQVYDQQMSSETGN